VVASSAAAARSFVAPPASNPLSALPRSCSTRRRRGPSVPALDAHWLTSADLQTTDLDAAAVVQQVGGARLLRGPSESDRDLQCGALNEHHEGDLRC